jgi:hypothetical protein
MMGVTLSLKEKFKYLHYSKGIVGIFLALIVAYAAVLFLHYQSVLEVQNSYQTLLNMPQGPDAGWAEGELEARLEDTKNALDGLIYAARPENTVSNIMESSFITVFSLVFGFLGLCLVPEHVNPSP